MQQPTLNLILPRVNARADHCRRVGLANRTHGSGKTPEYYAWVSMRMRCESKSKPNYHLYGARGIRVCERWSKFESFLADMGLRPSPKHSLDRIDNDGNYEPGNCRWATVYQQQNNRRTSRFIEFKGERITIGQLARSFGVSRGVLRYRINAGWDLEEAISKPVRKMEK